MRLSPPSGRSRALDMLPILNVVLLLLVFFMLAARLETHDAGEPPLPQAAGGTANADAVVLRMTADGGLRASGAPLADAELAAWVRGHVGHTLQIAGDPGAPAGRVLAVLAGLQAAGAGDVQLLVVPAR